MKKTFAVIAGVAIFSLLFPLMALAQPSVHRIFGKCTADGAPCPDGTQVAAVVEGKTMATATVKDGSYRLDLATEPGGVFPAGKEVTFEITLPDGTKLMAAEKISAEAGGVTSLDLSGAKPTPTPAPKPPPTGDIFIPPLWPFLTGLLILVLGTGVLAYRRLALR